MKEPTTEFRAFDVTIDDVSIRLRTAEGLFSPRKPDLGTLAMISAVTLTPADRLLDLGCGYGLVGIWAAKMIGPERVTMLDVDPIAVAAARQNASANDVPDLQVIQSDGFENLTETGYTKILSNPPYHADFSVPRRFILKGFNRLEVGGEMWFVTKREKWYRNKLKSVFGGSRVFRIDGYCVFQARKLSERYASRR